MTTSQMIHTFARYYNNPVETVMWEMMRRRRKALKTFQIFQPHLNHHGRVIYFLLREIEMKRHVQLRYK